MKFKMIDQVELKKRVHYDPITGLFTWLQHKKKYKIGTIAGNKDKTDNYVKFWIGTFKYKAHRLAWLYMTGRMARVSNRS